MTKREKHEADIKRLLKERGLTITALAQEYECSIAHMALVLWGERVSKPVHHFLVLKKILTNSGEVFTKGDKKQ